MVAKTKRVFTMAGLFTAFALSLLAYYVYFFQ